VLRIVSTVAELDTGGQPTGTFTVTYLTGLDPRNEPSQRPILRYIVAHALNSPEVWRTWVATGVRGPVTSVSAEGQSISYGAITLGPAGGGGSQPGAPGTMPTLKSLDRWRRRSVWQRTQPVRRDRWRW
jgi:hypothetical protein